MDGTYIYIYYRLFIFVSRPKCMDHVRPTKQPGEKPPQRLAQEKGRTHERDATPMGYEPNRVKP